MTDAHRPVARALLSVSDKTGVAEFAAQLAALGVELLSTGGTAKALLEAGLPVTEVSAHTGAPEIMDGRVKTLHPRIHGGILARRGVDDAVLEEQNIALIDLVVVNLYPFRETLARPDCTDELAIENIDIGGPAMLRAAAKNHRDVWVLVDPADYADAAAALKQGGSTAAARRAAAAKAFAHTASYDAAVANWFASEELPETLNLSLGRQQVLRYGENPHQRAAFYVESPAQPGTLASVTQHQGKALSYNNIADTDTALECVKVFEPPTCVIVKHANPCGVGSGADLAEAYERAFACDTTSAFGGIIAVNRELSGAVLEAMLERQFVEVVVAPGVSAEAEAVARKRKNVRLLSVGAWPDQPPPRVDYKRVAGGLLAQDADLTALEGADLKVVTKRAPTEAERADLMFAWKVAWFVKSNAIVYARDGQTVGIGAGQMARVISARIAAMKALEEGLSVSGAAMASDAFFPFRDSIDAAAAEGIRAIVQPGGSIRDDEVIAAADEHGMAMLFTGMRHFRH